MNRFFLQVLGIGLIAALAAPAQAQYINIKKGTWAATSITATAINTIAWTGWKQVGADRCVAYEINYTYSAGTAVTMRCETANQHATTGALPANDAGYDLPKMYDSATAGTSDAYIHTWSQAISAASEKWTWSVCNLPHDYVNCGFTATTGDGSDVATVRWRGTTP